MENERKKQEMQKKTEIDQAKLVQGQDIHEDKIDQNEELAELRADTSLEKQEMAKSKQVAGCQNETETKEQIMPLSKKVDKLKSYDTAVWLLKKGSKFSMLLQIKVL